jgi:hypothetical protein
MKIYDMHLSEVDQSVALEWLEWGVWCEFETTEQERPTHSHFITEYAGVAMWYDYAGDYYFFEDLTEEG